MPYPNEISRTAKATALATDYDEVTVSPFGSGDTALVCVPHGTLDASDVTVLICAHGHNGTEQTINNSQMISTRDKALDKGWIVMSAYAHGNAWANSAALSDYLRLHTWAEAVWDVTDVLLHGQSMGALTTANLYSRNLIPKVRAMVGIDGAYNLAQAFSQGTYAPSIRAAYGIAGDGSDYAAKTDGYDAVLHSSGAYAGKRLFVSASPADLSIPKADHSDEFVAMLGTAPAALEVVEGTGGHVTSGNYFPTAAHEFFDLAISEAPPDPPEPVWPTPETLPPGVGLVSLRMLIGGGLVTLEPSI